MFRQIPQVLVFMTVCLLCAARGDAALVGYWNFDNEADVYNDSSSNNFDGTAGGSATRTTSDTVLGSAGALQLNGTNAYMQLPDMTSLFTNAASLSMWVKLSNATPTTATKTGLESFGDPSAAFPTSHYPFTNGLAYSNAFRTDRVDGITLSGTIDRAQWHLLTITIQSGANGYNIYQNDTLIYSGSPGTFFMNSSPAVGKSNPFSATNYFLDGLVDEVRLYNTALTQSEIQALMTPAPEPSGITMALIGFVALLWRRHHSNQSV